MTKYLIFKRFPKTSHIYNNSWFLSITEKRWTKLLASTLLILRKGHVRNLLFNFCQLRVIKMRYDFIDLLSIFFLSLWYCREERRLLFGRLSRVVLLFRSRESSAGIKHNGRGGCRGSSDLMYSKEDKWDHQSFHSIYDSLSLPSLSLNIFY